MTPGWMWGIEQAEQLFLYLRSRIKVNLCEFMPPNNTPQPQLVEFNAEVATGIRMLLKSTFKDNNQIIPITLWWYNSSLFRNRMGILRCTQKNVLRVAFGVQGGIMAVRDDGNKESSPSNPLFF